jgi:hypothetical protein
VCSSDLNASTSFGGATASFNKPTFSGSTLGGNTMNPTFNEVPSWGTTPITTTAAGKAIVPDSPQQEI